MRAGITAGLLALASCTPSYDWPMYGRDATRNAVSPEKNPPTNWSAEEGKERNLAWKARLGKMTFGAPVISQGLVWVGTNNEAPRDPLAKGDAGVLMCFRERDGRFLWQQVTPRRRELMERGDWHGSPLRCSPLVEGDRLWYVNSRWDVVCLDIRPLLSGSGDPRVLWTVDLMERTGTMPMVLGMGFGLACSIGASHHGMIYLSTGNGITWKSGKMEHPDAPALVCLDKDTGEIKGVEQSGISRRTRQASWSSPVTASVQDGKGGERAIVLFGGGDGFLYAFDPEPVVESGRPGPGMLAELWKVDCGRGDGENFGIVAVPVVHQGRVYVGVGDDCDSIGEGALSCVDLASGRLIWKCKEFGFTMSAPVVQDGKVFAVELSGFVDCFDAETGRQLWKHDLLSTSVASPLLADGKLYVCDNDGEVVILDVGSPAHGIRPSAVKREMSDLGLCPPVLANGTLYLTGSRWLYAIREGQPGDSTSSSGALKRGRAPDAVYLPTPRDIVRRMLDEAAVTEKDIVYDLGSGDGRIVVMAASQFRCRAVGVELDAGLVEESRRWIKSLHLDDRVRIDHEDLLKADLGDASVITLYVGERLNRLLIPRLQALKPGVRIVSHEFEIPGMLPDRVLKALSSQDKRDHTLYLYTTPLKR